MKFSALSILFPLFVSDKLALADALLPMIRVPKGNYESFVPERKKGAASLKYPTIPIASFDIDPTAVTNQQFMEFVQKQSNWQKDKVSRLFSDASYLVHWPDALHLDKRSPAASPLVNVSWFAARAYCKAQGKRLPSTYEWEYLAGADFYGVSKLEKELFLQTIMEWYARPSLATLDAVGKPTRHRLGVHDLHGLIWEWTLDFNSVIASDESRNGAALEADMFCGAGSLGGNDPENYASYMRFAFRSSLKGGFALANLGFRCARDAAP